MQISVFGGSAPKPNSPEYQEAYQLGLLLGQEKHTVLTGGYIGTMEAVSRGAAEAGGTVVGVTCDEIETWRPVSANEWVEIEERYETLHERLMHLIKACDAALALPGGPGTLTEIMMMWNQMQTHALPMRPLILIGEGWKNSLGSFYDNQKGYIAQNAWEIVRFAPDVKQAVETLNTLL